MNYDRNFYDFINLRIEVTFMCRYAFVGKDMSCYTDFFVCPFFVNLLMGTSKSLSNGFSNTMIGTLAVDGWAVTFGTASRSLYLQKLQRH